MIRIKTKEEIKIMAEGGKKLSRILKFLIKKAKSGVRTKEIDKIAESLIKKEGGEPSFKKVKGYSFSTCLCVNDCVVHGLPSSYRLKEGDILGIDVGIFYKGFHTDMAWTIRVGGSTKKEKRKKDEIDAFLIAGEEALNMAIKKAKIGNHIGDISKAIQTIIEKKGYSVVRQLVGHGVGEKLHEEPQIPCFLIGRIKKTPVLKEGMTLAIEVIYNQKGPKVCYKNHDGWSIVTQDKSLSGLFEKTIAITKNGPLVLTPF